MNEENVALLEKLTEIIGSSGEFIVSEYVKWYAVSSLGWIFAGVAIFTVAWRWTNPEEWGFNDRIPKVIFYGIAGLLIFSNLPDLIAPTGISIHQLFKDITP